MDAVFVKSGEVLESPLGMHSKDACCWNLENVLSLYWGCTPWTPVDGVLESLLRMYSMNAMLVESGKSPELY
jgi:hypothetical protein